MWKRKASLENSQGLCTSSSFPAVAAHTAFIQQMFAGLLSCALDSGGGNLGPDQFALLPRQFRCGMQMQHEAGGLEVEGPVRSWGWLSILPAAPGQASWRRRYGVVPRDRSVELLRACSVHPGPSRAWVEEENGLPQALSDTVVCCSPAVAQNKLNKLS